MPVARAGWIKPPPGGGTSHEGGVKGRVFQGTVASGTNPGSGARIVFADLNADGREDHLDVDPTTGATRASINLG